MKSVSIHSAFKLAIKSAVITALPFALLSQSATAQTLDVKVTNLTQGIYFTPLLVSAHTEEAFLFRAGETASSQLQAMAEGGDISGLVSTQAANAYNQENPAGGLLAPAHSTTISNWEVGDASHLSLVGMLLPTNDGFVGLDSFTIPQETGTYTLFLNGYDAGTEANDEIINGGGAPGVAGIPANPGGNGGTSGTGVTMTESVSVVHIHRGNVGDSNSEGGASDLDSRVHRWLNPVAKVVVTVK